MTDGGVPLNTLHPRIRLVWILRALARALVGGGVVAAIAFVLDRSLLLGAGVGLLLAVLGIAHAVLRYRNWAYVVGDDGIYLERGVLTQIRTEVPLVRIQHVDSRRSALERLIGLATVVVYTAGSRGADVTIPGLTPEAAVDLRRELKRLAIAADGEDAV
jgi:membrane protein YdbS with pleckstrin-like domain